MLEREVVDVIIQDKTIYFLLKKTINYLICCKHQKRLKIEKIDKKKEQIENILQLQCSTIQRKYKILNEQKITK